MEDELELDGFLCVDEDEETSEQQPSTSSASNRNRNRRRFDGKLREVFPKDLPKPRRTARFERRRGVSRRRQRVLPLPPGRHPDYEAYLERRQQGGEGRAQGRKEGKPDESNGHSGEVESVRMMVQDVNSADELPLEEVDCCDCDDDSVDGMTSDSASFYSMSDDANTSNDNREAPSASPSDDCSERRAEEDPLWTAYEDDWPDLLGEVDEEAVRKAANLPIVVENSSTPIAPQLAKDQQRSSYARSKSVCQSEDGSDSRAELKRRKEKPSDGSGECGLKLVALPEKVSSLERRPRHMRPAARRHGSKNHPELSRGPHPHQREHRRKHSGRISPSIPAVKPQRHGASRACHEQSLRKKGSSASLHSTRMRSRQRKDSNGYRSAGNDRVPNKSSPHRVNDAENPVVCMPPQPNSIPPAIPLLHPANLVFPPSVACRQRETVWTDSWRMMQTAVSHKPNVATPRDVCAPLKPLRPSTESKMPSENWKLGIFNHTPVHIIPKNKEVAGGSQEKATVVGPDQLRIEQQKISEEIKRLAALKEEKERAIKAALEREKILSNGTTVKGKPTVDPKAPVNPHKPSRNPRIKVPSPKTTPGSVRAPPSLPPTSQLSDATKKPVIHDRVKTKPSLQSRLSITVQSNGAVNRNVTRGIDKVPSSPKSPRKPITGDLPPRPSIPERTIVPAEVKKPAQRQRIVYDLADSPKTAIANRDGLTAGRGKRPCWTATKANAATRLINHNEGSAHSDAASREAKNGEPGVARSMHPIARPATGSQKRIKLRVPSLPFA